jgi:hypothetical protein
VPQPTAPPAACPKRIEIVEICKTSRKDIKFICNLGWNNVEEITVRLYINVKILLKCIVREQGEISWTDLHKIS